MRLIDADAMNEELFYEQTGGKDTLITCESAFDMIKAQPTVYDMDKVVAELEELRDMYDDCIKNFAIRRIIDRAIEIAKQGGVSDDVCEWQSDCHLENDNPAEWLISPHNPKRIFSTDIIYCPYCGKKIKVVK